MTGSNKKEWWRGAVIYEIYPRSYKDTTGSGVGDLNGIIEKLDYIAALGVEGVWISPFYKSPMKDFGYDVSDYRDVDPMFGTLEDCKRLLDEAHKRNLKIIIDFVPSHTSEEHPWFTESRQNRDNPKADWYVWADPKPDGSPPNNWQAVFGGSSWDYDMRRGQYYLHNFLPSQPDLNVHNPEVRQALLDDMKFWLDLGVDGIRLDVINYATHDIELRDNPPTDKGVMAQVNSLYPTTYAMQDHIHDKSRPENLPFVHEIRALLDQYEDRMTVGEVGDDMRGVMIAAEYTTGNKGLHTAYNFSLLAGFEASASHIRKAVEEFENAPGDGWPSWAFDNLDISRVASRWHPERKLGNDYAHDPRLSKLLIALLCSLRATAFIYQGEELGLPDAEIAFEDIQDPWGKYLYPVWEGRDCARTPMPWEADEPHTGFSHTTEKTWLPCPVPHKPLAVDRQEADENSTLNFTRRFIAWRKTQPALILGDISFHDHEDDKILIFIRSLEEQNLICVFNLEDVEKTIIVPQDLSVENKTGLDCPQTGTLQDQAITLPPYGLWIGNISSSSGVGP